MHITIIFVFAAVYVTLKFFLYMILMPSCRKKELFKKLSNSGKEHYKRVVKDRRYKGMMSIFLGLILGLCVWCLYHSKTYNKLQDYSTCKHKTKNISAILFVTFWSMFIFYEVLGQHRFIFEERLMNNNLKDGYLSQEEINDLLIYSKIYKNSRYISGIVEVVSVIIAIIVSIIMRSILISKKIN